jgi:hypothetical protein
VWWMVLWAVWILLVTQFTCHKFYCLLIISCFLFWNLTKIKNKMNINTGNNSVHRSMMCLPPIFWSYQNYLELSRRCIEQPRVTAEYCNRM